jgi:hypothetical protein
MSIPSEGPSHDERLTSLEGQVSELKQELADHRATSQTRHNETMAALAGIRDASNDSVPALKLYVPLTPRSAKEMAQLVTGLLGVAGALFGATYFGAGAGAQEAAATQPVQVEVTAPAPTPPIIAPGASVLGP